MIKGADGMPTVLLRYGYYMNWGRPNHNISRVKFVIDALRKYDYGIKLEHDEEALDYVSVSYGDVCVENKGFQSNRNYHNMQSAADMLAEEFHFAVEEATEKVTA